MPLIKCIKDSIKSWRVCIEILFLNKELVTFKNSKNVTYEFNKKFF